MKVAIIVALLVLCTLSVDAHEIAKRGICGTLAVVINGLLDSVGSLGTTVLTTVSGVIDALVKVVQGLNLNVLCITPIVTSLLAIPDELVKALNECLGPAIAAAKETVTKACAEVDKALSILDDLTKCLQNPLTAILCLTGILSKILALPGALLAALNVLLGAVGTVVQKLTDCLPAALSALGPALTAALSGLGACLPL